MLRHARTCLLVLAGFLGFAPDTGATPTVDLSWHDCSPIVATVAGAVPGTIRLYASVIGQVEPHQAYQVPLYLRRPDFLPISDAWRFDASGCQGLSQIEIRHLPPPALATTCPAFQGSGESFQLKDYVFDPLTGHARLVLANRYPDGALAPDPAVRSFLVGVDFNHANSIVGVGTPGVTCGGFENDVLISLTLVLGCHSPYGCPTLPGPSWLDMQGQEHEFAVGNGSVTFCGSCAPVPAFEATWGEIKAQYRR